MLSVMELVLLFTCPIFDRKELKMERDLSLAARFHLAKSIQPLTLYSDVGVYTKTVLWSCILTSSILMLLSLYKHHVMSFLGLSDASTLQMNGGRRVLLKRNYSLASSLETFGLTK
jgi:hypothetical protein